LELLWKCRDIALLNKLRISNEGFKTGDHRTGEEREGKDQRLCKDYFRETNASWRPSCYEKVFMKYGQCLVLGKEVTKKRHRGLLDQTSQRTFRR
jgi:hypothetical protein